MGAARNLQPQFNKRTFEKEIMDGEHYTQEEFLECLKQLETINRWTQGYRPTLKGLNHLIKNSGKSERFQNLLNEEKKNFNASHFHSFQTQNRPFRIFDIGYGAGDGLIKVWEWAKKKKIEVELEGIDLNFNCYELAHDKLQAAEVPAQLFIGDGFEHLKNHSYDIITCSLLTHHLNDEALLRYIQQITASAQLGWVINDLQRHWLPYNFIKGLFKVIKVNRLIENDAPLSIRRSLNKQEWIKVFQEAQLNMNKLELFRIWSFRYGIVYTS